MVHVGLASCCIALPPPLRLHLRCGCSVSSQGGNICMHPKTKAETLTSRLLSLDFYYNYGMIIIRVRIYFITSSSSVPSSYFCLLAFPFSLLCLHVVHHIVCFTSTVISPIPNCCSVTDCHRFGGEGLTSRTRFTGLLTTPYQ